MKYPLFYLLFLLSINFTAQNPSSPIAHHTLKLSPSAEISVITCGPGAELYTAFGHSAFRVQDTQLGIDRIYNYGTFDFNQPNFYGNFVKGNTLYFLGRADTNRFLRSYQYEKRWVKGQVLDLKTADVQKVFDFLENNALPQNRDYLYNYFFDNCSTKLVDVIEILLGDKLINPIIFTDDNLTHRDLMQLYLGNNPWGDFGIDLGLGSPIDRKATPKEYLFLPENVFTYFEHLRIRNSSGETTPIVKRTEEILRDVKPAAKKTVFTPFILFSIIGLFLFFKTKKDLKRENRSRWVDFILFFSTGLIGVLLTFIWFGTNHISSANNFNVFWAFAPNLIVSFILLKKELPKWIHKYSLFLLILLGLVVVLWVLRIQVYSNGVLPILLFLGYRYYFLWKFVKTNATNPQFNK
ncbi:MAG: DUF4105 domain-containing protein [Flavobacteriaceae bacterium]|nr:DUF4105 domain-containing protein [Flavobacteriaceae bacterium]